MERDERTAPASLHGNVPGSPAARGGVHGGTGADAAAGRTVASCAGAAGDAKPLRAGAPCAHNAPSMTERRPGRVVGYRTWQWTPEDPLVLYSVITSAPGHPWSAWNPHGPTRATCMGRPRCSSALSLPVDVSLRHVDNRVYVTARAAGFVVERRLSRRAGALAAQAENPFTAREIRGAAGELREQAMRSALPPQVRCRCGLHAWHRLQTCADYEHGPWVSVSGAVLGWGRILMYREGWRAEIAQVVALVRNRAVPIEELGAAYGVAVVERRVLEAYALEFGERAPEAA
jgi:hypothetical protein